MENQKDYYIGLDMGTNSLGWAVADTEYHLLRAKGKDLWGVRTFEEAETAVEKRTNRVSRRRRQREKARIGMVKELFSEEILKKDPGFYHRLEESKFRKEDRSDENRQPYALFADTGYTDQEYFAQYPTIFHLRKELLESTEPHDVRLVYLAVLNMFHHRGHFLNDGDMNLSDERGLQEQVDALHDLAVDANIQFPEALTASLLEEILDKKDISRTEKKEQLLARSGIEKDNKPMVELVKLLCGLSAKWSALFEELGASEMGKKSFGFRDSGLEEKLLELEKELSDESLQLLEQAKTVHDIYLLNNLRKGCTYLSQARVMEYEKHHADLKLLQSLVQKYCPKEYDNFFRKMGEDNYSAYVGSVNSKFQKARRCIERDGKPLAKADFYKSVKSLLGKMPEDDENVKQILMDMENDNFLPKQLTASNGVIPNQLHAAELKKILQNAATYLPFLNETDETGLSVKEKIEQLFSFQLPYYVGPVNTYHKGKGGTAWAVRLKQGRVLPWNLNEMVDLNESRKEFIERMVRHCTYLNDERVLPKNSLLYEKYMVLNELNNLKIRNEKPSVELKQSIYTELFMKGKKVTLRVLTDFLVARGIINKGEDAIRGIDGGFQTYLSSIGKFAGVLGERVYEWDMQKVMEDLIFWGTVYSNDKKVVGECLDEKYPGLFSAQEKKRILGFKFKDWGRLSKAFLELEGTSKADGEVMTIIRRLWESNDNLMQLLSDEYTYQEELNKRMSSIYGSIDEMEYEDLNGMYLSAPVKRMVWQTILVLKDLRKVLPNEPKRIFVEMARGEDKKKERKLSRKQKFLDLYKDCATEEKWLLDKLESTSEAQLRSKKLYLYYLQKGRDLYTGDVIELEDLFADNLYDIDHIYPRHFVKDDNIDNNLVLVKKEKNAHKSDHYPLEADIQKKQYGLWKSLHDAGFMNDEKFHRLTRREEFSDGELTGFIARQLVETHQGTKIMTQILREAFPNTEIVFPKGGNVSEFRKKFDLLKVRNVNDFHHAHDAYLNIVVGNLYYLKFTRNPANFIRSYRENNTKYNYNLGKMFERDVIRGEEVAWIAPKDENNNTGTIATVKNVLKKNTPLMTRMTMEGHGGIAKQTVYSAKKAKLENYLPLKTADPRLRDVTKYGGVSNITTAYFFAVEHTKGKKRIRTIEMVPIYLKPYVEKSEEQMLAYCEEMLGLKEPRICVKKINLQSLIKVDGYFLNITGRSEKRLTVRNAVPLCLRQEWMNYVKLLNGLEEKNLKASEVPEITREKNIELFEILCEKHKNGIYSKKPVSITEKIPLWSEIFKNAGIEAQIEAILELLKLTECACNAMNAEQLKFKASTMKVGNNISSTDEFLLINQSPSGLFEDVIDLKTV
jgi:CRISPR-associated endonuclease Csn1